MYLKDILSTPTCLIAHVYLAGNYMGNSGCQLLADGLRDNDRVCEFDLSNNDINGLEGAKALSQIFTIQPGSTKKVNALKKINLMKNKLGDKGIELLSHSIKNSSFRVNFLNLSNCGIT